jgi:hypothetical protein
VERHIRLYSRKKQLLAVSIAGCVAGNATRDVLGHRGGVTLTHAFSGFYYQTVVRRYFFSLSIIMTANLDTILPIGKVTAEVILCVNKYTSCLHALNKQKSILVFLFAF